MEVVSSPDREDVPLPAAAGGSRAGIGSSPATSSKRPMNAFLLFCKRHRAIVKEEYPNLENRNITKILGEWWQNLKEHERADFHNLASEFKEHVMREQPGFRWRKQPVLATSNANNTTSTTTSNNTAAASAAKHKSNVITNNGVGGEEGRVKGNGANSSPESVHRMMPSLAETVESRSSGGNNNSSSSSSSTASSITTTTTTTAATSSSSAPKHFKKRILDAEKAKLLSVSPEAEQACKALMQLAGVRESSPSSLPASSTSSASTEGTGDNSISNRPLASNGSNNSRSGTSSPPSGDSQSKIESDHFNKLKGNVWNRVAKDLIQQQKQRATDAATTSADQPMNLSSQCTIFGQTIIEHIIENILDKPETNDHNLNNLATAEEIKERIYQGLKEDSMRNPVNPGEKESRTELWKLLPHVKLESDLKAGKATSQNIPKSRPAPTPPAPPPVQQAQAALPPAAASAAPPVIVSLPLSQNSPLVVTNGATEAKKNGCNQNLFGSGGKIDLKLLLASSPAPPTSPKQGSNVSITLVSTPLTVVTTNTIPTSSATSKPLNLSTTPPQTPSLSLTPVKNNTIPKSAAPSPPPHHPPVSIEPPVMVSPSGAIKRKLVLENNPCEEDDEIRRSSRSCKGRRYQEFKDEGRLGKSRRSHHKSGDSSAVEDPNHVINLKQLPNEAPVNTQQHQQAQSQPLASGTPFDVTAKLNALPALRFDAYKQRFSTPATKVSPTSGVGNNATAASSSASKAAALEATTTISPTAASSQQRRRSSDINSPANSVNRPSAGQHSPFYGAVASSAKRKTRRNANGSNGKKEEGLDVVVTS